MAGERPNRLNTAPPQSVPREARQRIMDVPYNAAELRNRLQGPRSGWGELEAGLSLATGLASSVPAGLHGLAVLSGTGGDVDRAAEATRRAQAAMTYAPRSEAGKAKMGEVGGLLETLDAPAQWVGQQTLNATGSPALATAAEVLVDPLDKLAPGLKLAAMPILGKFGAARGVPGEPLPQTVGEMAKGIPATTQKGLVHPERAPDNFAPGKLLAGEAKLIDDDVRAKGGTPADARALKDQVRDYRREHAIADGWQRFTVGGVTKDKNTGKLAPRYRGGFSYGGPQRGNAPPLERMARIDTAADGLVGEVSGIAERARAGDANAANIMAQARWYTDASRKFRDVFAGDSGTYGRLQGAMSPNTKLANQHEMADEFFHRALRGDFDKQAEGLRRHLAAGGNNQSITAKNPRGIPDAFIPRKLNGAKFGQNGKNGLMVMLGEFDKLKKGQGPKMRNFALNLTGESTRPTIDVWAGRTIQRLLGEGRPIPAVNDVAGGYNQGFVSEAGELGFGQTGRGKWGESIEPEVSGEYGIGLEAYEDAARKLGMDASDLQALMWFREKEIWEGAGHTPIDTSADLADLFDQQYGGAAPAAAGAGGGR